MNACTVSIAALQGTAGLCVELDKKIPDGKGYEEGQKDRKS